MSESRGSPSLGPSPRYAVGRNAQRAAANCRGAAIGVGAGQGELAGPGLGQGEGIGTVGDQSGEGGRGGIVDGEGGGGAAVGNGTGAHAAVGETGDRLGEAAQVVGPGAIDRQRRAGGQGIGGAALERAGGDRGGAGVGVDATQYQCARVDLGQRARAGDDAIVGRGGGAGDVDGEIRVEGDPAIGVESECRRNRQRVVGVDGKLLAVAEPGAVPGYCRPRCSACRRR